MADPPFSQSSKSSPDAGFKPSGDDEKKFAKEPGKEGGDSSKDSECRDQEKEDNVNSTKNVNAASINEVNTIGAKTSIELRNDPNMPALEDIVYSDDDKDVSAEADMNNLDAFIAVDPIPTTRVHKDHLVEQIIRDLNSAPQTRRMKKNLEEHGLFSLVQQRTNHKDFQNCLFACFLSQEEPKKVIHALKDLSWIEAMRDELLQFKLQKVWTLVDLPNGKRAIGTKWVYRNKKDERGIMIKNKALYGLHQAPRAWYETLSTYLLDNGFQRGKIDKTLSPMFCQPPGFEDPDFPNRVYKVEKVLYRLHQAPRAWYETLSTYLLDNGFQRGKIGKTLFIRRNKGDILLVQVTASKAEGGWDFYQSRQDEDGEEVDVHLYRSMIGLLMYLTSSRPDIMFVVCACARYQVNPKVSHLHAVKRIFRYLKGQPKLVFWYPKDSPFDLVAYTDSDYVRASLDMKSTTGGCQFLKSRLISWQCKKQTVSANSTTEAEYTVTYYCFLKLMLLRHNLLLLLKVNAARHNLQLLVNVNAIEGEGLAIPTYPHHTPTIIQPSTSQPQKKQISRRPKRKDTEIPQSSGPTDNVADEAVNEDMDDSLVRAATTATGLDAKQDNGNIDKTQSKSTPNEPSSLGTSSGGGPMRQETIGDTIAQTGVLDLENTKTAQAQEITSLKLRVKKLEKKGGLLTHKLKRLYKVGRSARVISSDEASLGDQEDASKQGRKTDDIDKDAEITLVYET
ncbi:putative ribonuclease H-like domain-containing protein [Tanacetum coccineum]